MTFYLTNDFLILSVFFFFVAWAFTKAFLWAGVLLKGVVFFVSFSLFITLEQMDSIEMTIISIAGAFTAFYGSIGNAFFSLKNSLENALYLLREIMVTCLNPVFFLLSKAKLSLIFVFPLFQTSNSQQRNTKNKTHQRQERAGKNKNKAQDTEQEQREQAKEQLRRARAEAKIKEEQEKIKRSHSANYRDARTFEEILGLQPHFTQTELKTAYKRASSRFHPDKYSHMSEAFRNEAEEEFKKVQRAYGMLKI